MVFSKLIGDSKVIIGMKMTAAKENAAVQEGIQGFSHGGVVEDLGLEKGRRFQSRKTSQAVSIEGVAGLEIAKF